MVNVASPNRRYAAIAGLGALAGGLFVVIATKTIPRMLSGVREGMMKQMMACMGEGGQGLPET